MNRSRKNRILYASDGAHNGMSSTTTKSEALDKLREILEEYSLMEVDYYNMGYATGIRDAIQIVEQINRV